MCWISTFRRRRRLYGLESFELLMLMSAYDMTVNYKAIFIICADIRVHQCFVCSYEFGCINVHNQH